MPGSDDEKRAQEQFITHNQFKAWLEDGYRLGTHESVSAELMKFGAIPEFLVEAETPDGKRWVFR